MSKCSSWIANGKHGNCLGTKECDLCYCNGDESNCDFYNKNNQQSNPAGYSIKVEVGPEKLTSTFSVKEILELIEDTKKAYLPSVHGPLNFLECLIMVKVTQRQTQKE